MIASFGNKLAEHLFEGKTSKETRHFPANLITAAEIRLDYLHAAASLDDLLMPPGNQLEALKGNRKGQHSIRINRQWRICFTWQDNEAHQVEVVDYH